MIKSKRCPKCKEVKPLKAFYRLRASSDGRYPICRECHKKVYEKCRKKHPERDTAVRKKVNAKFKKEHPERVAATQKRAREKRSKDPKCALSHRISSGMWRSLNGSKNGHHWETLVSYTLEDLMTHLEKLFKPGMTFKNRGAWHIDHKIPVSAFNFTKPEDTDFKKCWALSNLQPLWAEENLKKSSKIP